MVNEGLRAVRAVLLLLPTFDAAFRVLDLGRPAASEAATQQNAATKPRRSMSESSTVTAPEST